MPEGLTRHERRRTSTLTPPTSLLSSPVEGHVPLPPLAIPTQAAPQPLPTPVAQHPSRANTIDCLIAGRNPISNKVLETMLVRIGCRCVVVPDGAEAILAAGGVKFDVIWMDLQMRVGASFSLSPVTPTILTPRAMQSTERRPRE